MYWTEHLSQQERDSILSNLNEKQMEFVRDQLKRGRRTVFANVLASEKAGAVQGDNNLQIAEQWELVDYIDAGPGWQKDPKYYCECGRVLRYQYIVENKRLGQVKKFGITHFQEHTGISPELAKAIVKGIDRIDYEMDEILIKIDKNWTFAEERIDGIPSAITIPNDIQHHLDHDVPLLERQVGRLRQIIAFYWEEMNRKHLEAKKVEEMQAEKQRVEKFAKLRQEMTDNIKRGLKLKVNPKIDLAKEFQIGVMTYLFLLTDPQFGANDVCKYLVSYHGAPKKTFSSGKLKIYPNVCIFLQYLATQGVLEFVKQIGVEDRIYMAIELPQLSEEEKTDDLQMDMFADL